MSSDFDSFLFEPRQCPPPIILTKEVMDSSLEILLRGKTLDIEYLYSKRGRLGIFERVPSVFNMSRFDEDSKLIKIRLAGVLRSVEVDTDDPMEIVQEGVQFVSDVSQLIPLMHKTMDILQEQTQSFAAILYFVTQAKNEIYQTPRRIVSRHYITNWSIRKNSTVAAYVAATKEAVMVKDVWVDHRFPLGIGHNDLRIKAVICSPILSSEQEILGVIEVSRRENNGPYTKDDLDLLLLICAWFGNVIYQKEQRVLKTHQYSTITSLIALCNKLTQIPDADMIIYDMLDLCLDKLNAKAGYYYTYVPHVEGLLTEVYEYDLVVPRLKRRKRILDSASGSVASYVAKTHEMVNIRDVAADKRFQETDAFMSDITLTTVLCKEILRKNKPVGILQINNKASNGVFLLQDEKLFNIIGTFLSFLLELIEMQQTKKHNMLMNELLRTTLIHHLRPCGACLNDLTSIVQTTGNSMHWKAKSWDWVPEWNREGCTENPKALCLMLRNVLTPSSVVKHKLQVLILTLNKIYHNISKEKCMGAFYTFQMAFCILIRNQDMFRFTDKVPVLIGALFSPFASMLHNSQVTRNKTKSLLKNQIYHELKTLLHCLSVCDNLPDTIHKEFDQELKSLMQVFDRPSTSLVSSANIDESMERYLKEMIEKRLAITSNMDLATKQIILLSSNYHLFVRHFNYVMNHIEENPRALDVFYSYLGQSRKPKQQYEEDKFEFIVRFIENVVQPQFETLVASFSNCSDVVEHCTKLKANFERAIAGEPIIDWKVEPEQRNG
ncbi:hypothetical protein M8J75_003840 [Diaphorina citri]|nr:hypothetical protein M8J75_003840 [Diaphorina citri]KAI5754332.1 hypothetical protein M8J77_007842 [Diaphorina citri]